MRSILVVLCLAARLATPARAAGSADPAPPDTDQVSLSGTVTEVDRTLQGTIGARSFALVAAWLRANPHRDLTLRLDSPGGRVAFGAKTYDAIEAHGRVTSVVGPGQSCLSACTYLWLAGAVRTVEGRGALGFHSSFCLQACDPRVVGIFNQSLLDILARTEPALAVLLSNTGAMIAGNRLLAIVRRDGDRWALRTIQPARPHS